MLRTLGLTLAQLGFNPLKTINALRGSPAFVRDFVRFSRMGGKADSVLPILGERYEPAGQLPTHYFHQDLWAARKIFAANPRRHVDIGSAISGFVAHLLVFRAVEVVDVRPMQEHVEGLSFALGDATTLSMYADDSLESISTLHAMEHFGLGRYGDPVDPEGHLKFMRSLARVLAPGGRLYLGLPCGIERLYFNSHRVVAPETVLQGMAPLRLVSFSCIKDDRKLYENCSPEDVAREDYGCGLFEFTK